jgi:nitroreductase
MDVSKLKTTLKSVMPIKMQSDVLVLLDEAIALREFLIDGWRYQRTSGERDSNSRKNTSGDNLEAQITKDYHRVEKGLALHAPKRPFGAGVKERLTSLLSVTTDEPYASQARRAVDALDQWNLHGEIDESISPLADTQYEPLKAGVLSNFFNSRRSVRNFDPRKSITESTLRQAAQLASATPSVCNRQAARVHFYTGSDDVQRILRHQNGNTGFRSFIPAVAVVTVRRGMFLGPSERNQRWIDGGLFAMTLVWALHGLGLSTCMLNWSMNNAQSDALRQTAQIESSEDVIVLIAIGYSRNGHRIARSIRREVSDFATFK